jgi:hypothetical protein
MQPCYVLSMEKQINMNDPRIEIFKEKKQELTDKKRQASFLKSLCFHAGTGLELIRSEIILKNL